MNPDTAALVFVGALWVFVLAHITVQRKGDSPDLKMAKRIARSALTATLFMATVFAALALYLRHA